MREPPLALSRTSLYFFFPLRSPQVLQSKAPGSIGPVLRMRWRGTRVAVRKLHSSMMKDDASLQVFRLQLQVMSQLAHPDVVQFLGACTRVPPLYLVTEFMGGGTLASLLRDKRADGVLLEPARMMGYAQAAARALAYCHGRTPEAVVHRDVNPEAFLLTTSRDVLKLTNFGNSRLARFLPDDLNCLTGRCGQPLFLAPEMFKGAKYSFKVDVYSFAMLLYEIFEGQRPFGIGEYDGDDKQEQCAKSASEGERPRISRSPPSIRTVIESCWHQNPEQRPPFEDILLLLETAAKELQEAQAVQGEGAGGKGLCGLGAACKMQ